MFLATNAYGTTLFLGDSYYGPRMTLEAECGRHSARRTCGHVGSILRRGLIQTA